MERIPLFTYASTALHSQSRLRKISFVYWYVGGMGITFVRYIQEFLIGGVSLICGDIRT